MNDDVVCHVCPIGLARHPRATTRSIGSPETGALWHCPTHASGQLTEHDTPRPVKPGRLPCGCLSGSWTYDSGVLHGQATPDLPEFLSCYVPGTDVRWEDLVERRTVRVASIPGTDLWEVADRAAGPGVVASVWFLRAGTPIVDAFRVVFNGGIGS